MGGRARSVLLLALLALVVVGPHGTGLSSESSSAASARPAAVVALPRVGLPGYTASVAVTGGRSFVLHVPDGLLGPAPLLVALHPYAHDAAWFRAQTGLEALADRQGFVVAFPEGRDASWDAGGCCGTARQDGVDDVRYLDAVVAAVRGRVLVDGQRIALTGFSNGAMMALRYACERASLVSSVAVVAGVVVSPCDPSGPVAVLDVHGSQDRTVPLAGGAAPRLGAVFPPVRASLQPFADAGGEVALRSVPTGHRWPTTAEGGVAGAQLVWDWVRDHPRAAPGVA